MINDILGGVFSGHPGTLANQQIVPYHGDPLLELRQLGAMRNCAPPESEIDGRNRRNLALWKRKYFYDPLQDQPSFWEEQ